MGNRSGSSRSKSRDNKYKYPDPYHQNNPSNKNGYNQRIYSSQFNNGYSQPSYSNGYEPQYMSNPSAQYPIASAHYSQQNTNTYSKSLSNKVIYVANYDFTGTASSGELSFVKGDRLEILDRYTYNDWWQAKNLRTKQVGYVPANYISALNDLTACE